jgi:hypothetical protein
MKIKMVGRILEMILNTKLIKTGQQFSTCFIRTERKKGEQNDFNGRCAERRNC